MLLSAQDETYMLSPRIMHRYRFQSQDLQKSMVLKIKVCTSKMLIIMQFVSVKNSAILSWNIYFFSV